MERTGTQQILLPRVSLLLAHLVPPVEQAMARPKSAIGSIVKERGVRGSRPIIKGTRIPVRIIADFYKEGASIDEIILEYPRLTEEDVRAALRHFGLKVA